MAGLAPFMPRGGNADNPGGGAGSGQKRGSTVEEYQETESAAKQGKQTTATVPAQEESMSSKIGGAVMAGADTIVNAGKAGAEWVNRATDNMVVKGFSTSYGNVATQKDLNRFREAEKEVILRKWTGFALK